MNPPLSSLMTPISRSNTWSKGGRITLIHDRSQTTTDWYIWKAGHFWNVFSAPEMFCWIQNLARLSPVRTRHRWRLNSFEVHKFDKLIFWIESQVTWLTKSSVCPLMGQEEQKHLGCNLWHFDRFKLQKQQTCIGIYQHTLEDTVLEK